MNRTVFHVLRSQSPLASAFLMAVFLTLAGCGDSLTTLEYNQLACEEWRNSLQNRSAITFAYRQLFQSHGSIQERRGFPKERDIDGEGYMTSYKKMRAEIADYCRNI